MEREGKDKEGVGQKHEFERLKLKRGIVVRKRGSNSTPPATWRFGLFTNDGSLLQEFNLPSNNNNTLLSARKLAAILWEIQQPLQMSHFGERTKLSDKTFKKIKSADLKKKGMKEQHLQSVGRHRGSLQASTLATYSSSMEMAPYRPSFVRSNSLKFKSKFGEPNFNLTTSAELMRVVNRIWSLEEQHASARSLVKALKRELNHSQERIHELQLENESDPEGLVQSIKEELEDERRLRKQSEALHRKLGQQLSEVNAEYINALKAVERERNARFLLEELCDQFAKGIKEYDQEARFLKQKNKIDHHSDAGRDNNDGLILHLSEAWLDERMQTRGSNTLAKQKTISEKLNCEIETLLQAKRNLEPRCVKEMTKKEDSSILDTLLEESRKDGMKQQMHVNNTKRPVEITPVENHSSQSIKIRELILNDAEQRKQKAVDKKNNYLQAMLHRTYSVSVPGERKKMQLEDRHAEYAFDPAKFIAPLGPVEKWTSATTAKVPEICEHSKRSRSVKENTLQALLLDARLQIQQGL